MREDFCPTALYFEYHAGRNVANQMRIQHKGQLFFTSQLRLGAEFAILLPYSGEVAGS